MGCVGGDGRGRGTDSCLTLQIYSGPCAGRPAEGEAGPAGLHRQRQDTPES